MTPTPNTPDTPGTPTDPRAADPSGTDGAPDAADVAGRLRAVIQHLLPLLRGQSVHSDLSPSRLAALAALADAGPMRISELAERVGITLSTTSRMVDLLDGFGWIDRRPDPADQRATRISASAAGQAVLRAVREEHTARLAAEVARLPAPLVRQLAAALPALEALADQATGHGRPPTDGVTGRRGTHHP